MLPVLTGIADIIYEALAILARASFIPVPREDADEGSGRPDKQGQPQEPGKGNDQKFV